MRTAALAQFYAALRADPERARAWLAFRCAHEGRAPLPATRPVELSSRAWEALQLHRAGQSYRLVGAALGCSPSTVSDMVARAERTLLRLAFSAEMADG